MFASCLRANAFLACFVFTCQNRSYTRLRQSVPWSVRHQSYLRRTGRFSNRQQKHLPAGVGACGVVGRDPHFDIQGSRVFLFFHDTVRVFFSGDFFVASVPESSTPGWVVDGQAPSHCDEMSSWRSIFSPPSCASRSKGPITKTRSEKRLMTMEEGFTFF